MACETNAIGRGLGPFRFERFCRCERGRARQVGGEKLGLSRNQTRSSKGIFLPIGNLFLPACLLTDDWMVDLNPMKRRGLNEAVRINPFIVNYLPRIERQSESILKMGKAFGRQIAA